jgi:ornithine cyclodeaminase
MAEIGFTYLNGPDIAALEMADQEILDAVEAGLRAQGEGQTVIEPRVHLEPDPAFRGHFNVLRGYVAPLGYAGVKIVGDYIDNYRRGLPSEMALLNLFDPRTGMPLALLDATAITEMRTGAVTALGAKYLARRDSRVLGHIGARGTAYWNVRLLDRLFDFTEIRVHSRRPESREAFARHLSRDLGREVVAVDDWGQCREGKLGALRRHVETGRLGEASLHGELCEIVAGRKPGREHDGETILFWHRGLSLSDIALAAAMLEKVRRLGIGQQLRYA